MDTIGRNLTVFRGHISIFRKNDYNEKKPCKGGVTMNGLPEQLAHQRMQPRETDVRGDYFRDQTAIIHSTPFRRLKHKTQVFFAPENDHICTRIEHVMHVATVAATICRGLNHHGWQLDTELAYAAGLGHDLGHAPFGHSGERALAALTGAAGFEHELHSLRVVDLLARNGDGLNLTWAVRDAIVCHNGEGIDTRLMPDNTLRPPQEKRERSRIPATWEGCAVRFADKIAYLGRDIEDALLAGFITLSDVPDPIAQALGKTNGRIINSLVVDLIENSALRGELGYSPEKLELLTRLQEFNVHRIYLHPRLKEYERYCVNIIRALHEYLCESYERWKQDPENSRGEVETAFFGYLNDMQACYSRIGTSGPHRVTDYIAGMSDNYCLSCFEKITLPQPISFKG